LPGNDQLCRSFRCLPFTSASSKCDGLYVNHTGVKLRAPDFVHKRRDLHSAASGMWPHRHVREVPSSRCAARSLRYLVRDDLLHEYLSLSSSHFQPVVHVDSKKRVGRMRKSSGILVAGIVAKVLQSFESNYVNSAVCSR